MPDCHDAFRRRSANVVTVSLSRRRVCRWLLVPAAQLVAPSLAWANVARIASARLWPAHEYTRVIIEAPEAVAHQLRTLKDPHRVVLDLEGIALTPELAELSSRVQPGDPPTVSLWEAVPGVRR
jgi:N-acetylmuramoyl-L-alanine amidase